MNKKQLPLGMSSFKAIKEDNFLYIDKTECIYKLLRGGRYNFLARPRRFGKSLLVSTMAEIFTGKKDLCNDLWIGSSDYAWPVHPVIHIDFSEIAKSSPLVLEQSLRRAMDRIARDYNVDISFAETSGEKLADLVRALSKQGKVVILIDEYDAALTSNFHDMEVARKNRLVLREFYGVIKALDAYLRFLFITGVSKFTKTSLFSGLNNLNDISFDGQFGTIVGYTESDITTYLTPYIDEMAGKCGLTPESIRGEMRDWYNGYKFSEDSVSVYNPYSLFYYLTKHKCFNYWFESATPTFLIELLKNGSYTFADLENIQASQSELNTFDLDSIGLITLLYQTGYLTIESYSPYTMKYQLRYPNKEVEFSLGTHLLGVFLHKKSVVIDAHINEMRSALLYADIDAFCAQLQSLLAGIPYTLHIEKESYYHSLLKVVTTLLGFDVHCEVMTSVGRIDMVIEMTHLIVLFECKFNKSPAEALAQIKERKYAESYAQSGKQIVLVGVSFNFAHKELSVAWVVE
jgi:hypothetical protein